MVNIKVLTTQIFVNGHSMNKRDGVLSELRDPIDRELVMADFRPSPNSSNMPIPSRCCARRASISPRASRSPSPGRSAWWFEGRAERTQAKNQKLMLNTIPMPLVLALGEACSPEWWSSPERCSPCNSRSCSGGRGHATAAGQARRGLPVARGRSLCDTLPSWKKK